MKFRKMSVNVSKICGNMVSSEKKERESTLPDGEVLFLCLPRCFSIAFQLLLAYTLIGCMGQENGEKMTAAEIYESMDKCMEENKGKNGRMAVLTIRTHARRLGVMVGRTEDDILRFYFKMRNLGEH